MDLKEKARLLQQNLQQMEDYVAAADWEQDATDPMEKLMVSKDSDTDQVSPLQHYQGNNSRGKYRGGRRRPNRARGWNTFHDRRNSFEAPVSSSYNDGRYWHEGYVPSGNQSTTSFKSRQSYQRGFRRGSTTCQQTKNIRPLMQSSSVSYGSKSGSPTPSESASQISYPTDKSSSTARMYDEVNPVSLAKSLLECDSDDFSASLLTLLDKFNYNHREVRNIIEKHSDTFELKGEIVSLKPKIKVCNAHITNDGCSAKESCKDLHICPNFIRRLCYDKDCLLGHFWKTNHNQTILQAHFILSLQVPLLSRLFLFLSSGGNERTDKLNICLEYNEGKCQKNDCDSLHFCLAYLAKLCVSDGRTCSLNHSVANNKEILSLLDSYGISVNESPRDILCSVASCPLIKAEIDKLCSDSSNSSRSDNLNLEANSSSKTEPLAKGTDNDKSKDLSKSDKSHQQKKVLKTVWSHYFLGEITLEEICNNSVESFCPYEESGCWRLHSNEHFHWQVREKGKPWVNLRDYQVLALERAFCDPQVGIVDLPPLDPGTLEQTVRGLLVTLHGRSQWQAEFDTMRLVLKKQDNQQSVASVELRRLCTEDTPNQPNPCFFSWYFLDKNKKWIEYGQVDSTGDTNLISNIKSDDIEKHRRQRPNSPLSFQSSKFGYILDTIELKQTNLETNVTRIIRRRPRPHLKEDKEEATLKSGLPDTWEPMEPEERIRRVTVAPASPEYQKVLNYFTQQGGNYNIIKMERVQNPFLYKAFQNKVQELTAVYKSKDAVNIKQLFHGTRPDCVPKICEENFDWRLHGTSVGQAYGRGTYFSPLPATSHSYTQADPSGHRFMFIAQVAIGSITQGNSAMARPPINPQTNLPYDSTGNSAANSTVIVKYEKQEYYPEYILTIA